MIVHENSSGVSMIKLQKLNHNTPADLANSILFQDITKFNDLNSKGDSVKLKYKPDNESVDFKRLLEKKDKCTQIIRIRVKLINLILPKM